MEPAGAGWGIGDMSKLTHPHSLDIHAVPGLASSQVCCAVLTVHTCSTLINRTNSVTVHGAGPQADRNPKFTPIGSQAFWMQKGVGMCI